MLRVQIVAFLPVTAPSLIASGGVNIDFDRTVLVQMVLFFLLVLVLTPLLFRPLLRVFEERENRTEGRRDEAHETQAMIAELLVRYDTELERVQRVAVAEREKRRVETLQLEAKILEEARVATATIVDNGRKRVESEVLRMRPMLEQQTAQISQAITQRVLGREVD
jgi:F-type H+-transporting ATPase subunit b